MLESKFQAMLKKRIKDLLPGAIVMKTDTNQIQGFPDLLILYNERWATLECKASEKAPHRPNQDFYVKRLNSMSFSRFINPDNYEEVLHELQEALY